MIKNIPGKILALLLIIIVSSTIMSVYVLLDPIETSIDIINFDPLPSQHPSDLPSINSDNDTPICYTKLTECDETGRCDCGENTDVKCSDPDDETIRVLSNGLQIPHDGKSYCIPKDSINEPCNIHTGILAWRDDDGVQGWNCECKYPNLFNDPSTGCTTQVACINKGELAENSAHGVKKTNKLVYVPSLFRDSFDADTHPLPELKYYDPLSKDDDAFEYENKPNDIFTSQVEINDACSKYASNNGVDADGNPVGNSSGFDKCKQSIKVGDLKFVCGCDVASKLTTTNGNQTSISAPPYVRLPNDPYNCHIDNCWSLTNYNQRAITSQDYGDTIAACNGGTCSCGDDDACNSGTSSDVGFKIKLGKLKGMCYNENLACKDDNFSLSDNDALIDVAFDPETGRCGFDDSTGGANLFPMMCASEYVSPNDIEDFLRESLPQQSGITQDYSGYHWQKCKTDTECPSNKCYKHAKGLFNSFSYEPGADDPDGTKMGSYYYDSEGMCACKNLENPVGSEITSPCSPNPCKHDTMCSVGDESLDGSPRTHTCDCNTSSNGDERWPGGGPPSLFDFMTSETNDYGSTSGGSIDLDEVANYNADETNPGKIVIMEDQKGCDNWKSKVGYHDNGKPKWWKACDLLGCEENGVTTGAPNVYNFTSTVEAGNKRDVTLGYYGNVGLESSGITSGDEKDMYGLTPDEQVLAYSKQDCSTLFALPDTSVFYEKESCSSCVGSDGNVIKTLDFIFTPATLIPQGGEVCQREYQDRAGRGDFWDRTKEILYLPSYDYEKGDSSGLRCEFGSSEDTDSGLNQKCCAYNDENCPLNWSTFGWGHVKHIKTCNAAP